MHSKTHTVAIAFFEEIICIFTEPTIRDAPGYRVLLAIRGRITDPPLIFRNEVFESLRVRFKCSRKSPHAIVFAVI